MTSADYKIIFGFMALGHGPINLATIRAAIINTIKSAGYLYIPDGRRDHTRPHEALTLHGFP